MEPFGAERFLNQMSMTRECHKLIPQVIKPFTMSISVRLNLFIICVLDNFICFICLQKPFRKTIGLRLSNSVDLDHARRYAGPNLVTGCLQRLSARILLSCQPRVTVTSCFAYKVIRDL